MFTHYRTRGLVLKKEDKFEADRIFTIFTSDFGRIKAKGKAIRKINSKLRGGIDDFYLSEIEFIQGRKFKTLIDTCVLERFGSIRNDFRKLKTAFTTCEVLDNFLKFEEQDEKIWQLLLETFKNIHYQRSSKSWLVFNYFMWRFFSLLGYNPELYQCVYCQDKVSPNGIYFSFDEGGIACEKCAGKKNLSVHSQISPEVVKILRIILKENWNKLSKIKIKKELKQELKNTSKQYYLSLLNLYK